MKKMTAMLLSLVMCLSLLAIPAQAAFDPKPAGPVISTVDGSKDPGNQIQGGLPGDRDEVPGWD